MKIGVVVPVLSQFRLAVDALASIKTNNHSWQPYIIPNYRERNSVAKSWNVGTKEAIVDGCDYILIINDDIVVSRWTVDNLVDIFEGDSALSIVSGTDYRNALNINDILTMPQPQIPQEIIDAPDFACFMIRPDAYVDIGDFDEAFSPAYFEDNDYVYRTILSKEWKTAVRSQNAPFYHHGSQTQNNTPGGTVVPSDLFVKNRNHFHRKWGGFPGSERYERPFNQ
jgi:hypothetical protein